MTAPQTVAVLGLGMIGGSVARGLATQGINVVGYDINSSYLDDAVAEGVVSTRLSANLDELSGADSVVIAVYGDAAVEMLRLLEPHASRLKLVTDVGSTKRTIVAAAARTALSECFVGAHPFAGDHRSGWRASRFDLFEKETVYVCPTASSTSESVIAAFALWSALGAKPVKMDAAEHDELLAWTSHLPHVVSTVLALALADAGIVHRQLGRGGRDVTRLAAGSPDVWTAITLDNAAAIDGALAAIERQCREFRELLKDRNRESVREKLTRARDWSGPQER
jgi:prephenate dehydrogenase